MPKQLNLESLAMQAGLEFSGCPTLPETDSSCYLSIKLEQTTIECQEDVTKNLSKKRLLRDCK